LQGFLFIDEDLDILTQGSLIALQRENVIGLFPDDFASMSRRQPSLAVVGGKRRLTTDNDTRRGVPGRLGRAIRYRQSKTYKVDRSTRN